MLTIRLQRLGKIKQPEFRLVLAEKHRSVSKLVQEVLGHYNPRTKKFSAKAERLQHWLQKGVTASPTAHNLLVSQKILDAKKVKAWRPKKKKADAPATETPATAAAPTVAPVTTETPTPTVVAPASETPAA